MASFEIPDGPSTVSLATGAPGAPSAGIAQFTVNNIDDSTMRAQLSIGVQGASKPEWFTIDGDSERRLVPSNSETVNVKIAIPASTPAGSYPFRLRVAAVNDPDNDFIDGPTTVAEIKQAPPPPDKKGIPWWVWLIGALVLLGIVGGIVWTVTKHKPQPSTPPSASPSATPQAGTAWFAGHWVGTIDGRPAAMRWWNAGSARSPRFEGDFSDGNSGSYVPMTYLGSTAGEIQMRHPDGNTWVLQKQAEGQARGWTTWQGRQFPLVMNRVSTTVNR